MSPELVQVVKALIEQRLTGTLLLVGLICGIAAALGALIGAYLKKLGEHLLQEKFRTEILKQLQAQTHVVEETKLDFARRLAEFAEERRNQSAVSQELLKQQIALQNLNYQNRVAALSELARLIGAGSHNICWVSWVAYYHPDALTQDLLNQYDAEMHGVLGKIVGARVSLAALAPDVHDKLSPEIDSFYELDRAAGDAAKRFNRSQDESRKDWVSLYEKSQSFDARFLRLAVSLGRHMKQGTSAA